MMVLEVICKTLAIQNSSEWPCSMHPIPQLRLVGVRTSIYIYFFFLIFHEHPAIWTPLQIPIWAPPLATPCYIIAYIVIKEFFKSICLL